MVTKSRKKEVRVAFSGNTDAGAQSNASLDSTNRTLREVSESASAVARESAVLPKPTTTRS